MAKLVKKDSEGRTVYDGILTSEEKIPYEQLLVFLREKIPMLEDALKTQYGNSVLYKYYLGKSLQNFLIDNNVSEIERKMFWDEIKNFASQDVRKRHDGQKSKTRSFFEQCYILSQIDIDAVKKLSWRQWQDLLDRIANREDERIYVWIKNRTTKIREDDWREFEKALFYFLRNKDTSVFSDKELFGIYDSILLMVQVCREKFNKTKDSKQLIKQRAKITKRYVILCFQMRKDQRKEIDIEICNAALSLLLK
jgi:hypothetical protein